MQKRVQELVEADRKRQEAAKANKGNIPFAQPAEKLEFGRLDRAQFNSDQEWMDKLEI